MRWRSPLVPDQYVMLPMWLCVAGIAWWCPTRRRARPRSSCGKATWCSSIRSGRTAGTRARCSGRDRPACFPAALSRSSELEKKGWSERTHTGPVSWVTKKDTRHASRSHSCSHTQTVGPILDFQSCTFGSEMDSDQQNQLCKYALKSR